MALVLSFAVFLLSVATTIVLLLFDIHILVGGTFGFVATVLAMNFALGREIRSRHERVQAVLDNVPMAIWVKGEDMRYVFVNKFYERLFGFRLSQLLGKSDPEVFPENLRKNWLGNDRRVLATRSSIDVEEQIALGRRVRTIAAVMFPLMDSNERLYGLGGAAIDITDRKRTADAMQALAQPASAEDGDDFYLTCVRQLASTYGASRAFIVLWPEGEGRLKTIASWPLDEPPLFEGVTLEGTSCGEVIAHGRVYMDRGASARFSADTTLASVKAEGLFAAPLISASTRVIGVIGIVSEHRLDTFPTAANLLDAFAKRVAAELDRIAAVSALRALASQLEMRVRERTRELEQLNRELEAFSYSVSHDLRGPLRAIDGFVSLLGEDLGAALGDRNRGHLQRVRGAVKRMSDLIDDLLELAKVTQAQLHAENVDVTALVQQLLARSKEQEPERDVEVKVAPGMSMYGDSRLLHVAIDNLLGNAWKYTGRTAQAKIEAGIYHEDGSAVFYVRDNGVGFDPEYSDKLFKVFQRLHTSASFSGTGVGLAIVLRIAERHQGRVWAESQPEQGATFFFALPERNR
jgi:PAS domain S-box-containing protein